MANKKIDFSKHLFRASGMHNIMTGTIGWTEPQKALFEELEAKRTAVYVLSDKQKPTKEAYELKEKEGKITPKQQETLDDLRAKDGSVPGLTPKQQDDYDDLIYKRDNDELSEGIMNYLHVLHRSTKYNRRKELKTKYIKKGNEMEEEAITMLSHFKGEILYNNHERVTNKWITGEYDIFVGDDIKNIKEGYDTKCSWDLFTFPYAHKKLDAVYYWQNMSYMWLSGAEKWTTVYCLINTPHWALENMKYREGFEWPHNEIPKWKLCEILNNNIYDDATFLEMMNEWECIPDENSDEKHIDIVNNFTPMSLEERVMEKTTLRDEKAIKNMKQRIKMAREFLVELDKA